MPLRVAKTGSLGPQFVVRPVLEEDLMEGRNHRDYPV